MLLGITRLDVSNILVEELQVFLSCEVADCGSTACALLHIDGEGLGLNSLVTAGRSVIVCKFHRRNLELTLMAGNSQEVVDHRTLNAVGGKFRLIGDLGIIAVKVLGELYHRLLDQLEVTHATDDDTKLESLVGFHFLGLQLGTDIEAPYPTREVGWTRGQRVNLYLDAWCLNLFLDLHITRAAIEEGLKRVDVAVLLNNNTIERNAGNLQLTRNLWEHDILRPSDSTVRTTVDGLNLKTLLLGQRHLLSVETVQLGHLSFKLREVDEGIYLIGKQNRFLLKDTLLVGTHLNEEVRP